MSGCWCCFWQECPAPGRRAQACLLGREPQSTGHKQQGRENRTPNSVVAWSIPGVMGAVTCSPTEGVKPQPAAPTEPGRGGMSGWDGGKQGL